MQLSLVCFHNYPCQTAGVEPWNAEYYWIICSVVSFLRWLELLHKIRILDKKFQCIINYPGNGFNNAMKVFCFITQFLFLWNMNKTVFIVFRKIVGMILHKWGISGLSQSVSCPFADKQAFSVQFRSMDRGQEMCLGDRF